MHRLCFCAFYCTAVFCLHKLIYRPDHRVFGPDKHAIVACGSCTKIKMQEHNIEAREVSVKQ